LIAGHAYSIKGLYYLRCPRGVIQQRLIQVHNPWSNEYYTGPWNDKDTKWSDFYRKQIDKEHVFGANDGMFFMDLETFIKGFSFVTITYIHDDFFYSFYERIGSDGKDEIFTFDLPANAAGREFFVGLDFYPTRVYPNQCERICQAKLELWQSGAKLHED